jgi:predicted 3-demethylubiquinone-9 3-methyltransferase (glyoxalase superfamily)
MGAFESFPRITPFLWFDNQAEDAVNFYLSIFKNSRRLDTVNNNGNRPAPATILTIAFELDGQIFTALNGGPMFKFTEAVSFVIRCDSQEEVDDYYSKLSAGGSESQCGWVKDKFGLSWQIVPARLPNWNGPQKVEEGSQKEGAKHEHHRTAGSEYASQRHHWRLCMARVAHHRRQGR